MKTKLLLVAFVLFGVVPASHAQAGEPEPYSRRNTFAIFGEYSNDSSHIVLGVTPNRKLASVGAQYERRLFERARFKLSYTAEFRPFIVSSDPVANLTEFITYNGMTTGPLVSSGVVLKCQAGTQNFTATGPGGTETGSVTNVCTRQLTLAQGASPVGFRLSLMPHRPLQLTFSTDGGYMYATKQIPVPQAGAFNFTFNFGGGLEYFYRPHRSMRLEYLVQHYSNHFTAPQNPGVDSQFLRLSYAFGR